ncbi:hypothetical protein GGR56DRAFT_662314 [Xylariaceae sp. FL0804]|nr:hypothetical protein GGR56DRAFT_662314 [Xylariaceae sp. FL0804]
MEVAGLLLGGIPIALYAIDNYKRCLDPAKDYWRYQSTLTAIRMNVFVQKEQLDVTLRNIGLTKPSPLELSEHLHERHPTKAAEFLSIIDRMEEVVAKLVEKLDVDLTGKPKWTKGSPDRVDWEWRRIRRSFGRRERQQLVDELQYWNVCLRNVFEKPEIVSDESDPLVEEIQARFNQKDYDAIRDNAKLIHETMLRTWQCNCGTHEGRLALYWHSEKFPSPTRFELALPSPRHQCQWCQVYLKIEDTMEDPNNSPSAESGSQPSPLTLQPKQTAITPRKVKCFQSVGTVTVEESLLSPLPPAAKSLSSISCLCSFAKNFMTSQTGVLSCATNKERRFCLVAQPLHARQLNMVTVGTALADQKKLAMSRRQRFSLAAAVVWGMLCLCGSPWMDDGDWSGKEQLQLFVEDKGPIQTLASENPTITSIFRAAASGTETESRKDVTPAERYQGSQIRNRALFELGILLIELCLNTTLEQLRLQCQSSSTPQPAGAKPSVIDDYEVANRQLERVYLDAGYSYGYAVQRCLRCEFPGRDVTKSFEFQQFRRDFFKGVVAPIQATFVIQPSSCLAI